MERVATCKTCRFFSRERAIDEFHGPAGFCKRYPPMHFVVESDFGDCGAWYTPAVHETDWCGEWEPDESSGKP